MELSNDKLWNDKISSVQVTPGCIFKGYKHGVSGQPMVELSKDSNLYPGDANDQMSSWSCQCEDCEEKCKLKMGDEKLIQIPFTLNLDTTGSQQISRNLVVNTIKGMNIHRAKM